MTLFRTLTRLSGAAALVMSTLPAAANPTLVSRTPHYTVYALDYGAILELIFKAPGKHLIDPANPGHVWWFNPSADRGKEWTPLSCCTIGATDEVTWFVPGHRAADGPVRFKVETQRRGKDTETFYFEYTYPRDVDQHTSLVKSSW